jgi:hydroxyacylglutathione hydrolase
MISIKKFVFNPFEVNAFILSDETKECILIDPACYEDFEKKELSDFIDRNSLKPVKLLNTHCHVDHILGNSFISEKYKLSTEIHKAGLPLLGNLKGYGLMFGLTVENIPKPDKFIEDNQIIRFGNSSLKAIYTPGHADGSLVFYSEEGFVIVGDVLFNASIGRTDLPSGNHELLIKNIKNKLFVLPDNTKVYCGHGPETTIAFEKENNPFF